MHEVGCSIPLSCLFSLSLSLSLVLSSIHFVCFLLFVFLWFIYSIYCTTYLCKIIFPCVAHNKRERTLVSQILVHLWTADLWSCAEASFWNLKIVCAPSLLSKAVQEISRYKIWTRSVSWFWCYVRRRSHRNLKYIFLASENFQGKANGIKLLCSACTIKPQNFIRIVGAIFEKID